MGLMSELDIERQNKMQELSSLPNYKLVAEYLKYYQLKLNIEYDDDQFLTIMSEINRDGCRDAIIRLTANWYITEKMKEGNLWKPLC